MGEVVRSYEDLKVWQKAMLLVREVYAITESFPKKEQYRLSDQLCRAAVSIPSNIAEGSARRSTREYLRFVNIAYASLMECETQLRISCDLDYITQEALAGFLANTQELGKMLNALYASLNRKLNEKTTDHRILATEY